MLKCGIGGGLLALVIIAYLYLSVSRCAAVFSNKMLKPGNAHVYIRLGLGNAFGTFGAAMEMVKMLCVICALGFGIISYLSTFLKVQDEFFYLIYGGMFSGFFLYAMLGTSTSGNIQILFTSGCMLLLLFYWISSLTRFNFIQFALVDGKPFTSASDFFDSVPYAAWMFLGFEELPTVAGLDTSSLVLSKASYLSFCNVFLNGALTVVIASSIHPGVEGLQDEGAPLSAGLKHVYGDDSWVIAVFGSLSIIALLNPFMSFILFAGNQLQVIIHMY